MPATETTQPVPQERKPHFRRVPTSHFRIQRRDVEVLVQVQKHRFLRSTHIAALVGGSEQQIRRRLQHLFHHAYLDRPREQIDYHGAGGKKPYAYGLGNKGADLLAHEFGISREKVDWTAKNQSVGPIFLEHTLHTADFMVGLELACRAHGRIRLLGTREILAQAPEATRRRANPLGWSVTFRHEGHRVEVGVIPDKVFGLHFIDEPEGRNRAHFFLEADRGTMPVIRKGLAKTSFLRKLLAYHETWRQQIHTRELGIKGFRVLAVTSGPERARHLLEAARRVAPGGSRLFLFTHHDAIVTGNLLELAWTDGKGEPARLTD